MVLFVTIVHVIMCLILIVMVLFQQGKGASMGAAFGGASNTLFGAAGPANFLNKLTTVAAIVFMITSFSLALLSSRGTTSSKVLDATRTQQEQPVQQATVAPTSPGTAQPAASNATEQQPAAATQQPAQEASQATPAAEQQSAVTPQPAAQEPSQATPQAQGTPQ